MHIAYIGNFEPEHSTENEVARALTNNDHFVDRYQEGDPELLDSLTQRINEPLKHSIDFIMWTRTGAKAALSGAERYWRLLSIARRRGIPVVGYHLDRWWGLKRQAEIELDPFFRVDLLCTADGGHDDQWEKVGVNHAWFPPAISERNCYLGTPQARFASDIAFVGSHLPGYHEEWGHRSRLVRWLRQNYDRRVRFYPDPGQHAVRGPDLNDLYASVKVVVGDSCLVPKPDGSPMTHYCSDRVPETLGRGGILVHPRVKGISALDGYGWDWELDHWEDLRRAIDQHLDGSVWHDPAVNYSGRDEYVASQIDYIRSQHTYEVRMRQLVELLNERGMLR